MEALEATRAFLCSEESSLGEEELAMYPDVAVSEAVSIQRELRSLWSFSFQELFGQLPLWPPGVCPPEIRRWMFQVLVCFAEAEVRLPPKPGTGEGQGAEAAVTARRIFGYFGLAAAPARAFSQYCRLLLPSSLFAASEEDAQPQGKVPEAVPKAKAKAKGKAKQEVEEEVEPPVVPEEATVAFSEEVLLSRQTVMKSLCSHGGLLCRRRGLETLFPSAGSFQLKTAAEAAALKELQSLIARDNVICLKDFLAFMDRKIQEDEENDEEELRQAFRVMDKDGTGFIDMNEIRHIMLDLGSKLEGGKHCYPDEEYAHRAHRAEKGDEVKGPQLINFEEFKKMMSFQICCCIEAHFLVALIGHGVNRSNSKIVSMSGLTRRFLNRRWATKAVAAVFHEVGKPFELREIPLPEKLNEGELLVRMEVATICGSDLHTVSGKRQEPMPLVLGHEGVGVIERVGSDIFSGNRPRHRGWKLREGDRVTFSVADSCGLCPECTLHKLPQKCVSLMKYGHARISEGTGLNGTYATHILLRPGTGAVRKRQLGSGAILSHKLSSRICAPANCALATVVNALDMARLPRYGSNKSAVVQGHLRTMYHLPLQLNSVHQGVGLLGIYAVAWLRKRVGMDTVFCLDTQPERLKTAERFGGVPLLVTENEEDYLERSRTIREMYPRGVDVAVEMTGAKHVIHEGVQLLRNGGHYSFTGMVHPDSQLSSLTGETIIRKCLTIRGVHNYTPWNLEEAVKFLDEFREELPLESVLSPTSYKLSEINEAFAEDRGICHNRGRPTEIDCFLCERQQKCASTMCPQMDNACTCAAAAGCAWDMGFGQCVASTEATDCRACPSRAGCDLDPPVLFQNGFSPANGGSHSSGSDLRIVLQFNKVMDEVVPRTYMQFSTASLTIDMSWYLSQDNIAFGGLPKGDYSFQLLDEVGPTLVNFDPDSMSVPVPLDGSVNLLRLEVDNTGATTVVQSFSIPLKEPEAEIISSSLLRIYLNGLLRSGKIYTLQLPKGAVTDCKDESGNMP
eukprot:g4035.t1